MRINFSLQLLIHLLVFTSTYQVGFTQLTQITIDPALRFQEIDGFGAHQGNQEVNQNWWQNLYFEDLEASIYRVDLTPSLRSPYSDLSYFSPWFMGSQTKHVFNLEDQANPNGPEGNRVRTYTGPNDYSRSFGGRNAPIAVMGPDLESNISKFSYSANGAIAKGKEKIKKPGDFKLVGSLWSPVPWVKISSGNNYDQNWWPGPVINTPWPFIWGGNFAGGRLDVSGTPLEVFNDSAEGGNGPTSSLTQFARSTASYILGYQRFHGIQFYAISIQNELNFEQFYNSATYPLSSQYILAVKAIRQIFDSHPELMNIKIMGPEDLLGGDAYGMWEYGGNGGPIHKNLQYLKNIESDPDASRAVNFYCIHGYANDGVSSSGSDPVQWDWWLNGWTTSLAPGIPANIKGYSQYGKKSWMTETSGEHRDWLYPVSGFPGDGGLGVAIRIHQALTAGRQSAWIYWTFTDSDSNGDVSLYGLTNQNQQTNAPKYNAAKHYFKLIRPGSFLVDVKKTGTQDLLASAYYDPDKDKLICVLINTSARAQNYSIHIPQEFKSFEAYTSSRNNYWNESKNSASNGILTGTLSAYSVVSMVSEKQSTNNQEVKNKLYTGVSIYPNPNQGSGHIELTLHQARRIRMEITDSQGKIVQQYKHDVEYPSGDHKLPFKIDAATKGIYTLKLYIGSESICKEFMIF